MNRPQSSIAGVLAFAVALAAGALGSPSSAHADPTPPPPTWHRDAADPRWVQGEVTVDAPPDVVFARLEHVETWPQLLTDIARLKVLDHRDSHWEIELETRTLGHGMLGYDVNIGPGKVAKLTTNRMGVKAVGHTLVRPGPTPGQSNVVYSLFLEVSGLPSLLISDKTLREKQEHMLTVTLADFQRAFAPKPAAK